MKEAEIGKFYRFVILGNHRDAWTFGAVDPNSGTAALLEVWELNSKHTNWPSIIVPLLNPSFMDNVGCPETWEASEKRVEASKNNHFV